MQKKFQTNGPLDPASPGAVIVIPAHAEDLAELEEAIDRKQFLLVHGPRQSGKTTRMRVLEHRLVACGLKVRSDSFEGKPLDIADVTLADDEAVLLLDEFDALASHPTMDAILHHLRRQFQATRKPVICFGSFMATQLQPSPGSGSPFNCATFVATPAFTRAQLEDLFSEFQAAYRVRVDAAVLEVRGTRGTLCTTSVRYLTQPLRLVRFRTFTSRHRDIAVW